MDSAYKYLIILLFTIVISLFLILSLYISTRRKHKKNINILKQQQIQQNYIDNLEELHNDSESLINDIETSLNIASFNDNISEYTNSGNEYINTCDNLLSKISGNDIITDTILHHKQQYCESLGISFHKEIQQIPIEFMTTLELSSLLTNLLDNAIDAASHYAETKAAVKPVPFVSIESFVIKGVWILKVANSKADNLNPIANGMTTTKKDSKNHGMGTEIIRTITDRYNGVIKMTDSGDSFTITVSFAI